MSTTDSTGLAAFPNDESYPSPPQMQEDSDHPDHAGPNPNWRWFWLGLFLAVAPLLIPYFSGIWANATYRYFPFAIAAVVWLIYLRSDGHFYPPRGWFSWFLIGVGMLTILAGTILQFPWFASVGFVCFAATML
jgi:hypothetical protein